MRGEVDFFYIKEVRRYKLFFYLFFFVPCFFLFTTFYIEKEEIYEPPAVVVEYSVEIYLDDFDVNEIISENITFFVGAYAAKEKIETSIARAIIEKAIEYGVPVNLAFALAWTESRYSIRAYNYANENGSFDYGIFQLNSYTFPEMEHNLFYIENTNLALKYLRWNYERYGSFDLALVAYNAGSVNRFNPITQNHFLIVKNKKGELDEWFRTNLRDKVLRSISENKIFTPRPEAFSILRSGRDK